MSAEPPRHGVTVHGRTKRGRPCRLCDQTGTLARETLEALLDELIEQDQFATLGLSQGGTLSLDAPRFTHIQLEGRLYRLLLFRDHARIEAF